MAPRTMADIMAANEAAALRGEPALLYALLLACRRGTDRFDEADVAEWIEQGRARRTELVLPEAAEPASQGKAKRGPNG